MTGFTKLFSSIIHSTVWREEMHVKVVWITMLALADSNGNVWVSVPGLADAARVELDHCVDALERLQAPDQWSRTKAFEGRRIEAVEGGFKILNYSKYRELRQKDERRIQTREAVRKHREKKKAETLTVSKVSRGKPRKAQAEAEAEAEAVKDVVAHATTSPGKRQPSWLSTPLALWESYTGGVYPPGKMGKLLSPIYQRAKERNGSSGSDEIALLWDAFELWLESTDGKTRALNWFTENPGRWLEDARTMEKERQLLGRDSA